MLKIKEIREQKNITQDRMVELSGIKKRSYVDYENGKTDIPFSKLQNIATVLDVSVSELLGEKENKSIDTNAIPVNFTELSLMYVPLVNKYAYAGYMNGYGDDEYIEELPKIPFANDVEKGILTLHSLNEYYDDFQVHLKDVAKIFNIVDFRRKKYRR